MNSSEIVNSGAAYKVYVVTDGDKHKNITVTSELNQNRSRYQCLISIVEDVKKIPT